MSIKGNVVFNFILLAVFAIALIVSLGWPDAAKMYPLIITVGGVIFSSWLLFLSISGRDRVESKKVTLKAKMSKGEGGQGKEEVTVGKEINMMLWLFLYVAVILVFGFWIAMAIYPPIFMRIYGKESWKVIVMLTIAIWLTIFCAFHLGMRVTLFGGIFDLTWD